MEYKSIIFGVFLVLSLMQLSATEPAYSAVPTVTSVTPSTGPTDSPTSVTITGANFEPGAKVSLLNGGPFLAGRTDLKLNTWGRAESVYISGDYAYVANPFLEIYDISDPVSPVYVGLYGNLWEIRDVYVYGGYAYVITDWSTLRIIDVRDPVSPAVAGPPNVEGYVSEVYASGDYLYVAFKSSNNIASQTYQPGLGVFDISDPGVPVLVSFYETPDDLLALRVRGDYVYAVAGRGLSIFDISNPSDPVLTSYFTDDSLLPVSTSSKMPAIQLSGDFACIAGRAGMVIVDVSKPAKPVLAGNIDLPDFESTGKYEIDVSGNYAFVTARNHGLYIADISNPGAPVFVGIYGSQSDDVYVAGKYAYIVGAKSLRVIDISNPVIPALKGLYFSRYGANSVNASGSYAYMTKLFFDYADSMFVLEAIDATNPASPVETDAYSKWIYPSATSGGRPDVVVQGNYAYLAFGPFGLVIMDISDPAVFQAVGRLNGLGGTISVQVSGNYAYVIGIIPNIMQSETRLHVIDISNPLDPVLVSATRLSNSSNYVYVSGDYAYVANGSYGLQVIDVSDPAAPLFAGSYDTPGDAGGVYVSGSFAYVADGSYGLQVIDVSDPAAPLFAGSYDTPGNAGSVHVSGSFAYVADGNAGLQVIDVSDPHAPYLVDSVLTPGEAKDAYVSEDYTYVASGSTGLVILEKKGGVVTDIEVIGSDTITATFPSGLPEGSYHILVTNPGGEAEEGHLYNGFTVEPVSHAGSCKGCEDCGK